MRFLFVGGDFIRSSGVASGSSSISQWIAKRSCPTWKIIGEVAGASGGTGKCNNFFSLFLSLLSSFFFVRFPAQNFDV